MRDLSTSLPEHKAEKKVDLLLSGHLIVLFPQDKGLSVAQYLFGKPGIDVEFDPCADRSTQIRIGNPIAVISGGMGIAF